MDKYLKLEEKERKYVCAKKCSSAEALVHPDKGIILQDEPNAVQIRKNEVSNFDREKKQAASGTNASQGAIWFCVS